MDRIQFEGVGKRYLIGERMTAREALVSRMARLVRPSAHRPREFWSLRDLDFSVADGEALGIIGRNGAGKSTVLKIITRITAPTVGVARTRGRVAALLEVGTGFHPELTGRENIFLNGAILGMSRQDITRAFDAIVDFSGVERFLDTPVKRYSSGMGLRLGFSVAAHLDPDVLVVDEILAVGDVEFQRKCLARMEEAEQEGRTLVFVSHDLASLTSICTRGIWLEAGEIRGEGPPDALVRAYLGSGLVSATTGQAVLRAGPVTVHGVRIAPAGRGGGDAFVREDTLHVEIDFSLDHEVPGFDLAVYLTNHRGVRVFDEVLSDRSPVRLPPGRHRAEMDIPPVLNVGEYTLGLWFGTTTAEILHEPAASSFVLHGSDQLRPERTVVLDLPITVTSTG